MKRLIALAATTVLVAGCSATPDIGRTAPTPAPVTQPSAAAPSDTNTATAQIDGMTVKASMPDGAAPSGEELTVASSPAEIPAAGAQVAGAQTVRVRLGDTGAQPTKPITLTFNLSDKPDLASKFSDTVIPMVESVSESSTDATDLFRGRWDAATKTVTMETSHLSDFRLGAIDLGKLSEGMVNVYRAIRGETDSPCRDGSDLRVDGTKYTLTPSTVGPVAGCLRRSGRDIAIDFSNATQQFYTVSSTPAGQWRTTSTQGTSELLATLLSTLGNAKIGGILNGRGAGTLTLPAGSASVTLRADPAALQAKTILTGLDMLTGIKYNGAKQVPAMLEDALKLSTATECIKQTQDLFAAKPGEKVSLNQFREATAGAGGCLLSAGSKLGDKLDVSREMHKLGIIFSTIGELPNQLAANVTGMIDEISGANTLTFALTATAPSSTTKPAAEGPTTIDRIEAFSWAYDKVGEDTYTIPRNGPATVYIQFKSYSGTKQVRSGCSATITATGGGTTKTKTTDNCDSYDPGTYFELRNRGVYTFTIVVTQDGGGSFTATKTVTLQ